MHVGGEIHSFGSALARDELARLLEGASCWSAEPGCVQLLFEHLETTAPDDADIRPASRPLLSIAVKLCDLLPWAPFRGKELDHSDRRLRC